MDDNKLTYIGIIIIIIGIAAMTLFIRIALKSQQNVVVTIPEVNYYNNFKFEEYGDYWKTFVTVGNITDYEMLFYYHPTETLNISTRKNIRYLFSNVSTVYITLEPDLTSKAVIAGTEISKVAGQVFGKSVVSGLTKDVGANTNVFTCADDSPETRVIVIARGNETRVYNEDACIKVEAPNDNELIRAADRLAYEMLTVTIAGRLGIPGKMIIDGPFPVKQ